MKKLMTMIAAAAMSFGLFADNVISNSTAFAKLADGPLNIMVNDDGVAEGTVYWSYSADAIGDGEATIASNELVLKTGNKVLTRNFTGLPYAQGGDFPKTKIPEGLENGLFLDTQVKFGAPCDEIATDIAGDEVSKFAAFFVDETELETDKITDAATNLWVVASDGANPAAFRMQVCARNGDPVEISEAWLAAAQRVAVKAYASATTDNLQGFIIYVGTNFAKVIGKAPIANGAVNFAAYDDFEDGEKYLDAGVTVTVTRRYDDNQLVLSLVKDTQLQGAAFRGMGTVDSIYVGEVAPEGPDFTEVQFMDVELNGVTITVNGEAHSGAQIAGKDCDEIVVVATSSDPTKECFTFTGVDGVQNPGNTFTFDFVNGQKLTVTAIKAGAYMNGTAYATFKDAYDAALKLDTVVALTLNAAAAYPDEEGMTIAAEKVWTIDLNGQALTFNLEDGLSSCIENAGTLTITNSGAVATGKINNIADRPAALILNADGTVAIQAGIFDGALFGDEAEDEYTISGGSFRKPDNGEDAFAYNVVGGKVATLVSGYWVVGDEPDYVAQIGDKKYVSLQAALDAAAANAVIEVLANIDDVDITVSKKVTINGGSFTLTGKANTYAIKIVTGGDLTIAGGSYLTEAETTHSLFLVGNDASVEGSGTDETGSLTISAGTFGGAKVGNLVKVSKGSANFLGGIFNVSKSRGIKADGPNATVYVNGAQINADGMVAFAADQGGQITIDGGSITGTIQLEGNSDASTITIADGTIYGEILRKNGTAKGTITIPGDSKATFDRDQTAWCAAGYGTKEKTTGVWSVEELYTITFTVGDVVTTNKIFKGDEVAAADPAAPTGQSFAGWNPAIVTPAAADADYEATFTNNQYYVTYYTNNTVCAKVYYAYGAQTIEAPVVAGVEKWYTTNGGEEEFVFSGTVADNTQVAYATIAAPTPDPVIDPTKPDEPVTVKAADEEAAKKAVKISVPADVAGDVSEEAYQAYFTKTAVETSEGSGEWNVTAKLSDTVVKAAEETTEVAAKLSDIAAAETATSITIENARPGLYYSLVEGSTLEGRTEGARAKATTEGVTLQATHYEGSGFYQIKVSTTAE